MNKNNTGTKLKIIIFEGSFKTTPFIERLVRGLSEYYDIYILGFNHTIADKLENVKYVSLGSNQNKLRFIATALRYSLGKKSLGQFIKTLKLLFQKNRKLIQLYNFERAVSQINPDTIHVQWPSLLPFCEVFLLNKKYKIILSQRGSQINIVPFIDQTNFNYLKKWYPKIAGFHSVSKAISEKGDLIWKNKTKIDIVVYTGLKLEEFPFQKSYSMTTPLVLLSVGRAHWVKGYDYALKSCKLLKDAGIPFNYTIVGGAENEELKFLQREFNLEKEVSLIKRMPQGQVFDKMKSASLLMVPSIIEGLPNVIVEAMALGLPVLSTNCGGVSELIEDGCQGWTVNTRSPKSMANAIIKFTETPLVDIEAVRLAARKRIEAQHLENQMIEGMKNLYKEVVHNNNF
jgi:glycosyltransferase involved in cell wall biosynthesis